MKKFVVAMFIATLLAGTASAQTNQPVFFPDIGQCQSALLSGAYTPYEVHGRWRGPKPSKKGTHVDPLEAPACIEAEVVGGRRVVVGPVGFDIRWNDATGAPVAMDECGGNPIYSLAYAPVVSAPSPKTATAAVMNPPAEALPTPTTTINNYYMERPDVAKEESAAAAATGYNGWCGFWTDTGCTGLAGAAVVVAYFATRDHGKKTSLIRGDGGTLSLPVPIVGYRVQLR
jgi:hypothetical protein